MSFVRNNIIVEQALELAGVDVGTRFSNIETSISAIQTLLQSDNINLDTIQEIVDAIETVQISLATIIVNDLTTGGTTKALSAQQGVVLKALVDAKIAIADIVDNVTAGGTTKVLSAQQGVFLKGLIDSLSTLVLGKEDSANKSTSVAESGSSVKFPVWSAIVSYFSSSRILSILGISVLSGSNTGDETTSSIQTKRPLKTINGNSLEGSGDIAIAGSSVQYYSKRLTAIQAQSGIGLVTLNNLSFEIPAGYSGTFWGVLIFTSAATTTGVNYGINVLQDVSNNGNAVGSFSADVTLSSSPAATALQDGDVINVAQNTNSNYTILGTASTAGNNSAKFFAQITNLATNGSTFVSFVFASEVAGSAVSAQINSVASALIGPTQ